MLPFQRPCIQYLHYCFTDINRSLEENNATCNKLFTSLPFLSRVKKNVCWRCLKIHMCYLSVHGLLCSCQEGVVFLLPSFFSMLVSVCLPHSAAAAACSHPDLQVRTHMPVEVERFHAAHRCGCWLICCLLGFKKKGYLCCTWTCTASQANISQHYLHLYRIMWIHNKLRIIFTISSYVLSYPSLLYTHPTFLFHLCLLFSFYPGCLWGKRCQNLLHSLFSAVKFLFMRVSDSVFAGHKYMFHVCVIEKCKPSYNEKEEKGTGQLWEVSDIINTRVAGCETSLMCDLTSLRGILHFFLSDFHPFLRSALSKIVFCKKLLKCLMTVHWKTRNRWVL